MAGLAVALSLLLLCAPRVGGAVAVCALQAVVVAIAAGAQGHPWVAVVELAFACAIRLSTTSVPVMAGTRPAMTGGGGGIGRAAPGQVALGLAIGGVLALLVATLPGIGTALAVVLLAATLVATRPSPWWHALGLASLQNGVVLALIADHRPNAWLLPAVLPLVPALAVAGLWLGARGAIRVTLPAWPAAAWIDAAACTAVLALACVLPWQVPIHVAALHLDAFAALVILLLAVVATAASWARCLHRAPAVVPGARLVLLAGASLAVASAIPMLTWLALAIATMAAVAMALPWRAEAWRRLRLGTLGLGVALFATIGAAAAWPPASICGVVGIGSLAWLAPELALAAVAVIVRQRGLLRALPAQSAPDVLLLLAGLAALAIAGCGLLMRASDQRVLSIAAFGHGGVAVFAVGLGTIEASFAGLLHLTLLALTQAAAVLSREGGLERIASLAGLAGLPPVGMFSSLALILAATATRSPWLLLPLVTGLALLGWPILTGLSTRRPAPGRRRWQLAWIPLLLLLVAGFSMPNPASAWLYTVAAGAR